MVLEDELALSTQIRAIIDNSLLGEVVKRKLGGEASFTLSADAADAVVQYLSRRKLLK